MRVMMTGATGFVGRAVASDLTRRGHEVVAWVRSAKPARAVLGDGVRYVESALGADGLRAALAQADAVVNLAGAPILPRRWTAARKQELRASRVGVTAHLVRCMGATPPRVFVSASAVGYYGEAGDEVLTEARPPGAGFLAQLCDAWEAQARDAERLGVRVVRVRIGLVVDAGGGFVQPLLRLYRAGLGGPLGDGKQWMSCIHRADLTQLIATALEDERFDGALNAVMPESVQNGEFARTLGRLLHRKALLPTPSLALRIALGEAARALLESQRVVPARLLELGFGFSFPALEGALRAALAC